MGRVREATSMDYERRITKSIFLSAVQCPTLAWYEARKERELLTAGEQLRIKEGKEIGQRARALFPGGFLVDERDFSSAVTATQRLIQGEAPPALFEPAFLAAPMVARADVLVRDGAASFRLYEVKSSLHKHDEVKADHIDDLAYTAMVLRRAGVEAISSELIRIAPSYRLGMKEEALFQSHPCTNEVVDRAKELEAFWPAVATSVLQEVRPEPTHRKMCGSCGYFKTYCLGKDLSNSIHELPKLSNKKFNELFALKALSIDEIPESFDLTPNQKRVADCIRNRMPDVNPEALSELLNSVQWPAHYLDFETVKSALPLYPETAPHEQIVTQYSIHVCKTVGQVASHHEYLADPTRDCRRELAEQLLQDLGTAGTIVVYSSFEKTTLTGLGKLFPDLKPQLDSTISRIFDLEQVFKEAYYHPDFRGKTSIKLTLPVLVPSMNYKELAIGDGDTAIAMFVMMSRDECSEAEKAQIRRDLLRYCEQDTLAMVRLHETLNEIASRSGATFPI